MKPIDGDRLKAVLDDTEKTLNNIDSMGRESWDIYISAVGDVFKLVREAIDRMPALETYALTQKPLKKNGGLEFLG